MPRQDTEQKNGPPPERSEPQRIKIAAPDDISNLRVAQRLWHGKDAAHWMKPSSSKMDQTTKNRAFSDP
jgi:hypothetical protein